MIYWALDGRPEQRESLGPCDIPMQETGKPERWIKGPETSAYCGEDN